MLGREHNFSRSVKKQFVWSGDTNISPVRQSKVIHGKEQQVKIGDLVIIKVDERNRALWKRGIIEKLLPSKDGVVCAMLLRAKKSYLGRLVHHLHPLKLQRDRKITLYQLRNDHTRQIPHIVRKEQQMLLPISR